MFIDTNDKTIAFHPDALSTISDYLGNVETFILDSDATRDEKEAARSRVRAIAMLLTPGFGKAARVTPDGDGSLFTAEYADLDSESATFVFGCVKHSDGTVGVHS